MFPKASKDHCSNLEDEYPELEHNDRGDLENFCLYRDDQGFCSALETQCVLQDDD